MFAATISIATISIATTAHAAPSTTPSVEHPKAAKRILLMVDGVTPDAFLAAKARGSFRRFVNHAAHVAPFPSISDYAWSLVLQARQHFGTPGRIRHYEAAFFDEGGQRAHEDGRFFFHRLANPISAYGAVDTMLNPFIEGLAYFPTTTIRDLELAQIEKDLARTDLGPVSVAFFTVPDAIAHTRPEQLASYLDAIDKMIERVVVRHAERGEKVRIDFIADHGQTGAFSPEGQRVPLSPVNLADVAAQAGMQKSDVLATSTSVVFPVLALGSYTGGWTKTPDAALTLARAQRGQPFFDIAVVRRPPSRPDVRTVTVVGQEGEATLDIAMGSNEILARYVSNTANPLDVRASLHDQWLPLSTFSGVNPSTAMKRPFAVARIARTALEKDAAMPDILISFRDGFRIEGPLEGLTTMFQTHGSISTTASLGILATTDDAPLPPYVLSEDVLGVLKLPPASLYRSDGIVRRGAVVLPPPSSNPVAKTGANDLSGRAVFHRMTRVSDLSTAIVREDVAEAFLALVPVGGTTPLLGGISGLSPSEDDPPPPDWRRLLTANEIAGAIDAILSTTDLDKIADNPKLSKLPKTLIERIRSKTQTPPADVPATSRPSPAENAPAIDSNDAAQTEVEADIDVNKVGVAGRMALMRMHGIRSLLDRALTVAERSAIDDPRDHAFARGWHSRKRTTPRAAPQDARERERETFERLFRTIHGERVLAGEVFPAPLAPLFPLSPRTADAATVVYFPGIYDEVFDGQIFREGLTALKDMGIRVLEVPSRGSCSSQINAESAANFLATDAAQRRARGHSVTPYVFLGYSKGAVDALHLIAEKPAWTADNVLALVAIAAPLQGAQVLSRRDLGPGELALLTGDLPPAYCRAPDSAAGPSVTAAAMNAFFAKHAKTIADKTRYFSLSFEATLKEAHLWMKLTKNLAGFTGANDGVVAVEASRFPDTVSALDLGVLRADHLAGLPTSASQFDQRALFEALVIFLQEAGGLHPGTARSFRDRSRATSPWSSVDDRIAHLHEVLARFDLDLQRDLDIPQLATAIEAALAQTPFEVGPFDLDTDNGERVAVPIRAASFLGLQYQTTLPSVRVPNAAALARAILGPLRQDGRDLTRVSKARWRTFPKSDRPRFVLPPNNLVFDRDERINLRNLSDMLDGKVISPITRASHPDGIPLVMDRRRVASFRSEFEFYWEDLSPTGADDNLQGGWSADVDNDGRVAALLSSDNTSARMTSFSMRFRPIEFPQLKIELAIDQNTTGADVTRGGTGRDDSAFQIWFVVREINASEDRSVFAPDEEVRLFGYYWSDQKASPAGAIVENTYSQQDLVVVQLPEAKQLALGNAATSPRTVYVRNFAQDLAAAFPRAKMEDFEVVAVTFQHDSNDTKSKSRARFYQATLAPAPPP